MPLAKRTSVSPTKKRSEFVGHVPEVTADLVDALSKESPDGVRGGVVQEVLHDGPEHAEDHRDCEHVLETDGERGVEADEDRRQHRADEERGPAERLGAGEARCQPRGVGGLLDDGEGRAEAERFPGLREDEADEDPDPRLDGDAADLERADAGRHEPDGEADGRVERPNSVRAYRDPIRSETAPPG